MPAESTSGSAAAASAEGVGGGGGGVQAVTGATTDRDTGRATQEGQRETAEQTAATNNRAKSTAQRLPSQSPVGRSSENRSLYCPVAFPSSAAGPSIPSPLL